MCVECSYCCKPTEVLLQILFSDSNPEVVENLKLSLMKDLLHMHWEKSHDSEWKSDFGISYYKEQLELEDEKVDYLMESIIANEEILTNRQSDIQIKKTMQNLASTSAAMGVPLAAVYLSGSVLGVSAAGMTSGLAALGMGGVLGFDWGLGFDDAVHGKSQFHFVIGQQF